MMQDMLLETFRYLSEEHKMILLLHQSV